MRILVLIHEYPPVGGGGGQSCQEIVVELAKRGHEITVITAAYADLPARENHPNLNIMRVLPKRKNPFKAGFFEMAEFVQSSFLAGLKQVRNWDPDIIHTHFAVPAGAAAHLIHLFSGKPYVMTIHLGDIPGGVPEKTGNWFRFVYPFTIPIWKKAAKIIAVSSFSASLAERSYNSKPMVIPNGIRASIHAEKEIHVNDPPVVFFAGRFVEQKNLREYVNILSKLKHIRWRCTMVGDGPLKKDVEELIKTHGVEERFLLPGWVDPEAVREYMKKSDILFMPSLSEGLSVVGVQSLAAGLAIVATNVGGFSDIVRNGINGSLVEPSNPGGLRHALESLLTDPLKLASCRKASLEIAEPFDIRRVVDRYEAVFSTILPE